MNADLQNIAQIPTQARTHVVISVVPVRPTVQPTRWVIDLVVTTVVEYLKSDSSLIFARLIIFFSNHFFDKFGEYERI